ncbi:LuxR C-terminal-related transcriptional regulator [Paraburkholderia sp. GAS334]|uniref:helix-turn-helix transcriptional regulator n=1 Tax=Paraburkholderia sp. GAS334 TaxID=3035131 RepID=UPI003D25414D
MKSTGEPASEVTPSSLLATKVAPPRAMRGAIARGRLTALATEVEAHLLTLAKAPAGFGKTTLALAWVSEFARNGLRVGWFSVDPEDNDEKRFFYYLYWAVLRADKDTSALQTVRAHGDLRAEDLRNLLLNHIADLDDEFVLIVDNYHCVTQPRVHAHVAYLLQHAPSNLHLVLLTQEALPFSLVRLQIQGQVLELNPSLLRFTFDEAKSLLGERGYSEPEIGRLHAATHGWPAALRIAVLSPTSTGFGTPGVAPINADQLLQKMIAEWLGNLPIDLADFLERTTVSDRLCSSLCSELTGSLPEQAQATLESLESQQMLVARLDETGNWFGYHQLMRMALSERMNQRDPGIVPVLHRTASQWFARHELWEEAVKSALAGGDTQQALAWIEACAMPLVRRGELPTLLAWQRQLGAAFLEGPIKLKLAIAWANVLAINSEEHLHFLDAIEAEIHREKPQTAEALLWECKALRAGRLGLSDDTEGAWRLATECAEHPVADRWMMNTIHNVLRFCDLKACRWQAFYATPNIAYAPGEFSNNVLSQIYHFLLLGMGKFVQLELHGARQYLTRAVDLSVSSTGPDSYFTALTVPWLARLQYEQLDFDGAERQIESRLELIATVCSIDTVTNAFVVVARIALRRNQIERAHSLLARAEKIGVRQGWVRLEAAALLERLRVHIHEGRPAGDHPAALTCLTRIARLRSAHPAQPDSALAELEVFWSLAQGYYALANKRFDVATAQLSALHDASAAKGNNYLAVWAGSALALGLYQSQNMDAALRAISAVIDLAAPAGVMATVLEQGPDMAALLKRFRDSKLNEDRQYAHAPFLDAILLASRNQTTPLAGAAAIALTPRELSILDLVAQLKSNKEISRALGISLDTVKTHMKNILAKLSVGKRIEAARRAEALGLIRCSDPYR